MAPSVKSAAAPEPLATVTHLQRLEEAFISVPIVGKTPLIPHKWSEKSKTLMRDKQTAESSTTRKRKDPKRPQDEAHDSCYWLSTKDEKGKPVVLPAMPATAFRAAAIDACRFFDGITIVGTKYLIDIVGEIDENGGDPLVPIKAGSLVMREDTPRNASGVADLRYRMQAWPWEATLLVRYIPSLIGASSVLALIDAGGRGGVGDWRPSSPRSRTGTYGQFAVRAEAFATLLRDEDDAAAA